MATAGSAGAGAARPVRLAAGRARALGVPTRGTTAPNRLRRVDRWITGTQAGLLSAAPDPLVVDLGFGASPVTTVELAGRLRAGCPGVRVVGLEIDRQRVLSARDAVAVAGLRFEPGGFELAGLRPVLVRAMNVLRQYDEPAVGPAWTAMTAALAPGGLLVEGTCDEVGRRCAWVALDAGGPRSLTFAAHLASLTTPGALAERLPKALIHRNVPGEPIHAFLADADGAWAAAAPQAVFGPRARWMAAAAELRGRGWPLLDGPRRWRLGELTIRWDAVAPG